MQAEKPDCCVDSGRPQLCSVMGLLKVWEFGGRCISDRFRASTAQPRLQQQMSHLAHYDMQQQHLLQLQHFHLMQTSAQLPAKAPAKGKVHTQAPSALSPQPMRTQSVSTRCLELGAPQTPLLKNLLADPCGLVFSFENSLASNRF